MARDIPDIEIAPQPLESYFQRTDPIVGLRFEKADIVAFTLHELQFEHCEFIDCVFDESTLRGSSFASCRFAKCSFKETRFIDCRFSDSTEAGACAWELCNLSEAVFESCSLGLNKVTRSVAYMATFKACAAMGLAFDADVHRKVSNRLIMGGVAFLDCRLQYAVFAGKDLSESKFENCDLRDASFARSNLTACSFVGSAINNIDFTEASLDRAVLSRATFDAFDFGAPRSYAGLCISRDQQDTVLRAFGIEVMG